MFAQLKLTALAILALLAIGSGHVDAAPATADDTFTNQWSAVPYEDCYTRSDPIDFHCLTVRMDVSGYLLCAGRKRQCPSMASAQMH